MRAGLQRVCGSDPLKPSGRVILVQDHFSKSVARFDGADSVGDMALTDASHRAASTSFFPSCVQLPSARLKIHARSVRHPPTMAVLPSAESATDIPWPNGNAGSPVELARAPTSFLPCCGWPLPGAVRATVGAVAEQLSALAGGTVMRLPDGH